MEAKTEEELFDEWKALFNQYRFKGMLPEEDRKRFIQLSKKLRKLGYFKRQPSTLKKEY